MVTNRLLKCIGIRQSLMCDRCNLSADRITHRFWTCQEVQIFRRNVEELLQRMIIPDISILNKRVILCGCLESLAVDHIIMLGKIMISKNISIYKGTSGHD